MTQNRITISIDNTTLAALDDWRRDRLATRAAVIRQAIRDFVRINKNLPAYDRTGRALRNQKNG
jgi:metal-responsive CopG/Arc/MetJ family transcriptional regulator